MNTLKSLGKYTLPLVLLFGCSGARYATVTNKTYEPPKTFMASGIESFVPPLCVTRELSAGEEHVVEVATDGGKKTAKLYVDADTFNSVSPGVRIDISRTPHRHSPKPLVVKRTYIPKDPVYGCGCNASGK